MQYSYKTQGICAKEITFEVDKGIVHNVRFNGGCAGNGAGVGRLAEGLPVDDVIKRLEGIPCGARKTSCPDQLAKALKEIG